MFRKFRKAKQRAFSPTDRKMLRRHLLLSGKVASRQVQALDRLHSLADAEFRVCSQWGEDGIIEWLCHRLPGIPRVFVEFGVEHYTEANTRFLLENRSWRGLIIDPSAEYMDRVRAEEIFWRHDLTTVTSFITAENVNDVIGNAGFKDEIGLLSIDIDGNDYWVLKHLDVVRPAILILEVNTVFGDRHAITIPYDPQFSRLKAHHSGQYFGASIRALQELAESKGYRFLGTVYSGINAFFVRNDLAEAVTSRIDELKAHPGRHRDSRDSAGRLTYVSGEARAGLIGELPVYDLSTNRIVPIEDLFPLSSEDWFADR